MIARHPTADTGPLYPRWVSAVCTCRARVLYIKLGISNCKRDPDTRHNACFFTYYLSRIHVLKIRSSFFPTHFFSPFSSALPSPLRSKTRRSFTPPLSLSLLFSFRPCAFDPSTMAPSKTPGGTERKKGGFRPSDHFRPASIRPLQKTL